MVVPIRELVNITHSTVSMANNPNNLTPSFDIDIVIDPIDNIFDIGDNFKDRRGCSLSLSMYKPKSPLIFSSKYSEDYHVYIKRESDRMDEDKLVGSIGSIRLEYESQGRQKDQVNKATDTTNNMLQQHALNKNTAPIPTQDNNMFNIKLNYDCDQALDLEKWDSEFYTTLLHGLMEHLVLDVKNIKDFLQRMDKYIRDKEVNNNPNNCKDLEEVGKAL